MDPRISVTDSAKEPSELPPTQLYFASAALTLIVERVYRTASVDRCIKRLVRCNHDLGTAT
jgi:hypothetical protein